jgi:hypothetical protein
VMMAGAVLQQHLLHDWPEHTSVAGASCNTLMRKPTTCVCRWPWVSAGVLQPPPPQQQHLRLPLVANCSRSSPVEVALPATQYQTNREAVCIWLVADIRLQTCAVCELAENNPAACSSAVTPELLLPGFVHPHRLPLHLGGCNRSCRIVLHCLKASPADGPRASQHSQHTAYRPCKRYT